MKRIELSEAAAPAYPAPASHLSERAQSLWRELGPEHATTTGRQLLLLAMLEALDEGETARRTLQVEGLTTRTTASGVAHLNPVHRVEREARQQFAKLALVLNLEYSGAF